MSDGATIRSSREAYDGRALVAHDPVRREGPDYVFAHALVQEGVYASLLTTASGPPADRWASHT